MPRVAAASAAAGGFQVGVTDDRRGVVMMEFIIALLPVMLAFLGFTQFCFAGIAKLAVRHSAALVTRAAVVVLEEAEGIPGVPDNIYEGFKAGGLEISRPETAQNGAAGVNNAQTQVSQVTSATDNKSSNKSQGRGMDVLGSVDRSTSRIKQIRTAAYVPLLFVSPSLIDDGIQLVDNISSGQLFQKLKVRTALGEAGGERVLGALLYNMGAVAVTFPKEPGSKELTDGMFEPNELITARVTYLFRCQVPLASLLLCASGWSLLFGDAWFDPVAIRSIVRMVGDPPTKAEDLPKWTARWKQEKSVHDRQQQRVEAFKGHEKEFQEVEWPFMLDVLLAMPGARYMVLSAEAQLPLQSAKYYPRANADDMKTMWDAQDEKKKNQTQMPDVREGLRSVKDLVSNAANKIDKQVDDIKDTVNDLKQQVNEGVATATATYDKVKTQANELVSGAQKKYDEAKSAVDGKLRQANAAFNSAKAAAQQTLQGVKDEAAGLVKDAKKELDAANAALRSAKKQGGAALQAAQQRVTDAQGQLAQAQRDATSMVQGAEDQAKQQIGAAQRQLDDVQRQGKELLGAAQEGLDRAKHEASTALNEATDAYKGAVEQGKGLVQDTKGEAARALRNVKGAASQAASSVGNATSKAASSAAKSVTDTTTDLGDQLKNVKPPGGLDIGEF
jgi:predicted  nucleic acid-binding Zn-ribbon protein